MKKGLLLLYVLVSLIGFTSSCNQPPTAEEKLSVEARMTKARAAKADKKGNMLLPLQKATLADHQAPVDKVLKGPNGEVVHTGELGAKFYINKYGNKTYLSSNR